MRSLLLLPWLVALSGCVGGIPPECFSDGECSGGQRCVDRVCAPLVAVDAADAAKATDAEPAINDALPDALPMPADARSLVDLSDDRALSVDLGADARTDADASDGAAPEPDGGAPEPCNGFDDDGDGVVDEGNRLGEACVAGVGECTRGGHRICGPDGTALCDAAPSTPQAEICDGNDNDCDGEIDEDEPERACYPPALDPATIGRGPCIQGLERCGPIGQAPFCVGAVTPAREQCDGLDNDCDDRVDEDFGVGGACEVVNEFCSRPGVVVCGDDGLSGRCEAARPPAETCNAIDDDCDGQVDDGIMEPCYSADPATDAVGVCRAGLRTCKNGAFLACLGQVVPSPELAENGLDDDCDGDVDEN